MNTGEITVRIVLPLATYELEDATTLEDLKVRVGRNITKLRGKLKGRELARRAGLTPSHLLLIERGESWPSAETWAALSIALNTDPFSFLLAEIPLKERAVSLPPDDAKKLFMTLRPLRLRQPSRPRWN